MTTYIINESSEMEERIEAVGMRLSETGDGYGVVIFYVPGQAPITYRPGCKLADVHIRAVGANQE